MTTCNYPPYAAKHPEECQTTTTATPVDSTVPATSVQPPETAVLVPPATLHSDTTVAVAKPVIPATGSPDPMMVGGLALALAMVGAVIVKLARRGVTS